MDYSEIFGRTLPVAGHEMAARLADGVRVLVVGVGGVGSWAAEGLVRSGLGHITIVDADTVAVSNINRQLPATCLTVGRPKVDLLAEHFRTINPDIDVTAIHARYCAETADDFDLSAYDYVVDAIDDLDSKALLILRATATPGLQFFSSMGAARKLDPSQIAVAEFWQVKGCPLGRALRERFKRSGMYPRRKFKCVYSPERLEHRAEAPRGVNGTFMPATAIFGLTLASCVLTDMYKKTAPDKKNG